MLLLDAFLRFSTVTLLLMLAYLIYRDGPKDRTSILGTLTAISVAALLLGTPHPQLEMPQPLLAIVRFMDVPAVVLIWWFGCSLFDDEFRIEVLHWSVLAFFILTVGYFRLYELGVVDSTLGVVPIVVSGCSIALMCHVIWVALVGRNDDMVEARRRFRLTFAFGMALITIATVVAERMLWQSHLVELNTFRAGVILPFIVVAINGVINYLPEKLNFKEVNVVVKEPSIDPRDDDLHVRLLDEIEKNKVYREHGLTITALAAKLDTPEHRLRALINKGLKFRNFSSFLNHHRICAIKIAMNKPENRRTPILTLALEEGFRSLAPFNRAFKAVTGLTPSEYKQQILDNKPI